MPIEEPLAGETTKESYASATLRDGRRGLGRQRSTASFRSAELAVAAMLCS